MPQLIPGNIDLHKRPIVKNPDGSISTVRSASFEDNGLEVLVPTVSDDGRILTDDQAWEQYKRTGKHLGKFKTSAEATEYAEQLHKDQEREYMPQSAQSNKMTPETLKKYVEALRLNGYNEKEVAFHTEMVQSGYSPQEADEFYQGIKTREATGLIPKTFTQPGERPKTDFLIDLLRPVLSSLAGTGAAAVSGPAGIATAPLAYTGTDIGLQNLKSRPTPGMASKFLMLDPKSWESQFANTGEQALVNKAAELTGTTIGKLTKPAPSIYKYGPTVSQAAESEGQGLVSNLARFFEDKFALGAKTKTQRGSAEKLKSEALRQGATISGMQFTPDELANEQAMYSKLSKQVAPTEEFSPYVTKDIMAQASPLKYEPVTRTTTQAAPIIKNRTNTITVTPSTPVTSNWVDTRIVPGPTRTGVFEAPNILSERNPLGQWQKGGGRIPDPDKTSIFTSRPIPGTPRTEILGKGREVVGSKIGPPRTIRLGEEEYVAGSKITGTRKEKIGERLVPGKSGEPELVKTGAVEEVPKDYLPQLDAQIRDDRKLSRMISKSQTEKGEGENLRKNIGSYHFMRMFNESKVKDPKTGQIVLDAGKFNEMFNDERVQKSMGILYNSKQRADIKQFITNMSHLQDKPPKGGMLRLTSQGMSIAGPLVALLSGHPKTAMTGAAIGISANGIGRLLSNPKTARLIVALAGGEPLGMPETVAIKFIANALNGTEAAIYNIKTGKTEDVGRFENGRLVTK